MSSMLSEAKILGERISERASFGLSAQRYKEAEIEVRPGNDLCFVSFLPQALRSKEYMRSIFIFVGSPPKSD